MIDSSLCVPNIKFYISSFFTFDEKDFCQSHWKLFTLSSDNGSLYSDCFAVKKIKLFVRNLLGLKELTWMFMDLNAQKLFEISQVMPVRGSVISYIRLMTSCNLQTISYEHRAVLKFNCIL